MGTVWIGAVEAACPCAGAVATPPVLDLISFISDLLCFAERRARLKQVIKNIIDKTVVARVRNVLVFVPSIDSTPEKVSTRPPPRPAWTRISAMSNAHAIT